ncbi:Fc receptor-like protein 5 [Mobula birostris]|uniref:Fc receptor-like protein 5 n=1 Tax=Mobula birostris TaxID=1983395 RepID=UPI003B28C5FF
MIRISTFWIIGNVGTFHGADHGSCVQAVIRKRFVKPGQCEIENKLFPMQQAPLLHAADESKGTAETIWDQLRHCRSDSSLIPRIDLDQHVGVYIKGESVVLTCNSLGPYSGSPFTFYRNREELSPTDEGERWARLRLERISDADKGSYTCRDSKTIAGRKVQSAHSKPVEIHVTDPLLPPVLSLYPQMVVYLVGETVTLTCNTTEKYIGEVFSFYRNDRLIIYSHMVKRGNTATLTLIGEDYQGRYQCRYGKSARKRWLWSQISEAIEINVTDYPQKPSVSVSRDDYVFLTEETATLTCRSSVPYPVSNFYLHKIGQTSPVQTATVNTTEPSVVFNLASTWKIGTEDYSCGYKSTVMLREILSERSDYVKITVVEPLPVPRISSDQSSGVYVTGETVTITCNTKGKHRGSIYFYKNDKLLATRHHFLKENILSFRATNRNQVGQYQCQFEAIIRKRRLLSQTSEILMLTLSEPLTPPTISLDQLSGVYLEGETATATCSINQDYDSIYFYRDNEQVSSHQLLIKNNTGTFPVSKQSTGGQYKCQYRTTIGKRQLWSPTSKDLTLTVVDSLAQPVLSLDEPSGVYLDGETVTMTCNVYGKSTGSTYFYRNHVQLTTGQLLTKGNIGKFSVTNTKQMGLYQCSYVISFRTRSFDSPFSQHVRLSIADPLTPPDIALDRPNGVYAEGETAILTCTVSGEHRGKMFFYRNKRLMTTHELRTKANTGVFVVTSSFHGSRYQCKYGTYAKARWLESQLSEAVTLTVVAAVPVPKISLDKSVGVYSTGETIILLCDVNGKSRGKAYFYRENELLKRHQIFSKGNIGKLTVTSSKHGGWYRCKYKTVVKRRPFWSELSEPVMVTIADSPKPRLTLNPRRAVRGGQVTFNCTSPLEPPGFLFYLFKQGDTNYLDIQPAAAGSQTVNFTLKNVEQANGGNYTCLYKAEDKMTIVEPLDSTECCPKIHRDIDVWEEKRQMEFNKCEHSDIFYYQRLEGSE